MTSYVTNTISYDKYESPIKHYAHCGWQPDSDTSICNVCQITIKPTLIFKSNKHHCRFCGKIICSSCSQNRSNKHRICDLCLRKKLELKNSIIKISSSLPRDFVIRIPKPIKINNSKFLFVSYDNTMYYYDTIKNEWSTDHRHQNNWSTDHRNQQDKFPPMQPSSIALNAKTNEIFGINDSNNQQKLIKINLLNRNVTVIDLPSVYKLDDTSCMFINNQYHVIGGKKGNQHYILDHKTNILTAKWTFNHFGNILKDPGLIYLESKQILYSFGGATRIYNNGCGWNSNRESKSDFIYKCVPTNHKLTWKKLNVRMPFEASNFGIVSCKHDKYILLFITEQRMYRPGIFIFDVEKETFKKSLVESPVISVLNKIQIFIPTDFSYKMSMLLSGYFHLNKIRTCEYLPQDIINLVMMFGGIDSDFVHILSYAAHWKLNIDYILDNTEEIKDKRSVKHDGNLESRLGIS